MYCANCWRKTDENLRIKVDILLHSNQLITTQRRTKRSQSFVEAIFSPLVQAASALARAAPRQNSVECTSWRLFSLRMALATLMT